MTTDTAFTPQADPQARDVLTQKDAEARAARVKNTHYDLKLDLTAGAPTYKGDLTITFDLTGEGDTFLDHRGTRISALEINGKQVEPRWNGYRLWLPGDALAAKSTVHIVYENTYDHTGDGLHQFIDPEDKEEYLYTNFEPYEAHRLFPCFDQPDIKASYTLTVTCPAEWEVIGNSNIVESKPAGDGRSTHRFEQTKPFSTYLFALVAGPYHAFRQEHNGIPIGLFCRKSLVKYFDIDEVFTLTRQGLDFFAEFFDYPYPFTKYDQIYVPEFNAGAMENVGCVTFNERRIFRDPPTDLQRLGRAEVILHEMGHMWFGNLVTMRWWNDLWLNESFATYISYLAMAEATRFRDDVWQNFLGEKAWAYHADQLSTTHPIAGEVPDTDATFLNFDGITYGKGAAAIKQLVAAIGHDGFREGMRVYFKRHEYGNTTLAQFLKALEDGSNRSLGDWSRLWLETPSLNTLSTVWEADGERITDLRLTQTAPEAYPTIRPHTVEIGLVREVDGGTRVEAIPATIDAAEAEVEAARGKPRPNLVFPNYNDHTFAKIALDPESLDWVRANLDRIEDPLLREQLWASLWDMVRDQKLKSTDYLALARAKVEAESNLQLIENTLGRMVTAFALYTPEERRKEEGHLVFETAWQALKRAPEGDAKIIWARSAIGSAINEDDLRHVIAVADGQESIPGLTIDQEMRWTITARAVALGLPGVAERVEEEKRRDPSDRGQRAALRCATSVPDAAVKAEAWGRFHGEGYGSLYNTSAAMSGFHWVAQRDLLDQYVWEFFERVPEVFTTKEKEAATAYFGALFPGYRVEQAVLDRSERLIAELGDRSPMLTRKLREANDDLSRAIACRAFAAS